LAAAAAAALSAPTARAAAIYIGDDAAEGKTVTAAGGTTADTVNVLTYAFSGTGSAYTSPAAQTIRLTEVNFISDEGGGTLRPFVALYNGGNNQLGASYTILSIGDAITPPAGTIGGGGTAVNAQFLVGGVNPEVNLAAGNVLVAGLVQTSRIVLLGGAAGSNNDYINNGNSLPAAAGSGLTSDSDFALNRTLRYNVGFDVPEPAPLGLLAPVLALAARRRRRAR
jgi:hypothetical protein